MTYTIFVQTDNAGKLHFKGVKEYSEEGSYIKFKDERTQRILLYPILKTQIEEDPKSKEAPNGSD